MTDQINDKLSQEQLIERFASINNLSLDEAHQVITGATEEEVLKQIEDYTLARINERMPKLNRAQRRALKKKQGKKQIANEIEVVTNTAQKLNYIDLIQQLRELNKIKEKELEDIENATAAKDN